MKNKILIILIVLLNFSISAQDTILLADRDIKPTKDNPVSLHYGVHKGDKIIINLSTKRDKSIDYVEIGLAGDPIIDKADVDPTKPIEFTVTETNFLNFKFYSNFLGQNISVKIERIPQSNDSKFFNPSIYKYKKYDTSYVTYEIDSVIDYEEIRTPKTFKVIKSAEYESVELKEQKVNLKGGSKKGYLFTKPKELIKTDYKEMKFLGYQVMIFSQAGGKSMWKYIGLGVDVGCLCMSLAFPAAGTAAGLGVQTAFEMVGPQEGGEPVYYIITNDKKELDKFTDNDPDTRASIYESGLATGYNGTWFPMDTLAIGVKNLNMAVEIDVSIAVYAIYQATIWEDIKQDIITIKPKTVKVERTREVIENKKYWGFEK